MTPIVETRRMSRFPPGGGPDHLLTDITISLPEGRTIALLGGNGAGKSTFLRMLMGLLPIGAGEAFVGGRKVPERGSRGGVGYLGDPATAPEHLTGREYLQFMASLEGLRGISQRKRVDEVLELLGLHQAQHLLTSRYSKGMLQRLDIGRVLLVPRRLMILDEPLTGLDASSQVWLEDHLQTLKRSGTTLILTSHAYSILEKLADHYVLLRRGRLAAEGSRDEVLPVEGWRLRLALPPPVPPAGATGTDSGEDLRFTRREDLDACLSDQVSRGNRVISVSEIRDDLGSLLRRERLNVGGEAS